MTELTCPYCKESFKDNTDRKYFDCPFCKAEFSERDIGKEMSAGPKKQGLSLLEKLKQNSKKDT